MAPPRSLHQWIRSNGLEMALYGARLCRVRVAHRLPYRAALWLLAVLWMGAGVAVPPAYALRESRALPIDPRLHVMTYNPNDVFKYTGFYGYQASIEFSEDEVIENISMGDTMSWQMVPAGHRLFLKPMEPDATTNMTLLTNLHTYHFELHAEEAEDIHDPNMVFTVRFIYPDEGGGADIQHFSGNAQIDFKQAGKYNFQYTMSGEELISPIKIFDDGQFTYFEFKDKNAKLPAIFAVQEDGTEAIINYRIQGPYVVVESVVRRFTLRNGHDIACVFNELEEKRRPYKGNRPKPRISKA